ncbi:tetratricopeptide repeat protein [Candidatus Peregrinibacteria bacterium]|jgi:tetratricopeptide (TPR) repeat protein|nr:tetratricopeptide repeat protein [Candidatus Peregrinibacteria bacterium]MBT4148190.1 tetratricopeptide repeat protein [Candidatus Peregrinibacteria bacterium]MBT4365901.1 tetratricopeptide repeat protein [Candidatus Peregrinibacteria bacterium]MBT4455664.1 tetratricopeptide repeat protein [Candidatus Peregrinibacteria bacterium]
MNKILKTLWFVIIAGAIFLGYIYMKPPSSTTDTDITPEDAVTSEKTDLQKESFDEAAEEKNPSDYIAEGDNYHNQGYLDEAIKAYHLALVENPDSIQTLYKLGITYFANNQNLEARQYFNKLKENYESSQIDILIGRTYINKQEMPQAISHFNQLDPNNPEVKYYKAIFQILQKNNEGAQKELTSLLEILNSTGPNEVPNEELEKKVKTLLDTYNAISINKDSKEQHKEALLSKALIEINEFQAAIPLLFDVIKLQNNYRDAWVMLGYSYLNTGQYEDAINALFQAKVLDPGKAETLFFIGITYAVQEMYDEAITYLEDARDSGFEPISLVEQKLADLNLIKQNYDQALVSYENIINAEEADLNLYTKAIWISIEKLDKPHKAIQLGEKAVAQHPEEAISYSLRGWGFISNGDYEKGKNDLVAALELDPKLEHAYLSLGLLYEKQELSTLAKEYYKKAYMLGNGNSIANLAAIRFNNILKADITSPYSP